MADIEKGYRDNPAYRQQVEAAIKGWKTEIQNRNRYGYIADESGRERPIIMLWGEGANTLGDEFEGMIQRIRNHYGPELNPYFVMTQHGLWTEDDRILESVDAFYNHPCAVPEPGTTSTTVCEIGISQGAKFDSWGMGLSARPDGGSLKRIWGTDRPGRAISAS